MYKKTNWHNPIISRGFLFLKNKQFLPVEAETSIVRFPEVPTKDLSWVSEWTLYHL